MDVIEIEQVNERGNTMAHWFLEQAVEVEQDDLIRHSSCDWIDYNRNGGVLSLDEYIQLNRTGK